MKQLNVREINTFIEKKQTRRKESFEKVLQQCFQKIRGHAAKEQIFCLYEVPEFIYGYPLYDLNECISYLYDALNKNGFRVDYFFPRVLQVSWGPKDRGAKKKLLPPPETLLTTTGTAQSKFIEGVRKYKPSGKFVLELT